MNSISKSTTPVVSQSELAVLNAYHEAMINLGGDLLLFGSRSRRDHKDNSDFDIWLRLPKHLHRQARQQIPVTEARVERASAHSPS